MRGQADRVREPVLPAVDGARTRSSRGAGGRRVHGQGGEPARRRRRRGRAGIVRQKGQQTEHACSFAQGILLPGVRRAPPPSHHGGTSIRMTIPHLSFKLLFMACNFGVYVVVQYTND